MKRHHIGPPPGLASEPLPAFITIAIVVAWVGSGIIGAFFLDNLLGKIAGYIILGNFVWACGYTWFDNERTKKRMKERDEAFAKFKETYS